MKTDLSEQFEAEFSVEVEVKADLRWSESGTNSVWAQQRMGQVLKKKNGTTLTQLGDTIEAGHQGVRWFRSWPSKMVTALAKSARCPILDAVARHGNVQGIGWPHFASIARRTKVPF